MNRFTKRFTLPAAFGLAAALAAGQAYAQMEGIGNGGLGDARAQNQPTSLGINNHYGPEPYRYGYGPAPYGYGPAPVVRGRSAYVKRYRHRHPRHW